MRDVVTIRLNEEESIVIASDNSGAIGMKELDAVHVPYEIVAYYCARVALMECIAAGAEPFSIAIQNFCEEDVWEELISGIKKTLKELQLEDIVQITGSTESNFKLMQSAVGVVVIGKKKKSHRELNVENKKLAVIGSPLFGDEVISKQKEIAPLYLFQQLNDCKDVCIIPIGSKGILYEIGQLLQKDNLTKKHFHTDLDLMKSAGPSTCFLIAYPTHLEAVIRKKSSLLFHPILYLG